MKSSRERRDPRTIEGLGHRRDSTTSDGSRNLGGVKSTVDLVTLEEFGHRTSNI